MLLTWLPFCSACDELRKSSKCLPVRKNSQGMQLAGKRSEDDAIR